MDSDYLGGILSMAVATLFFGSMFVPIKPYDTRDGFFVMWVQSVGIFFLGAIVNVYQVYPQFYTWAAVAGVIWTTGNICTVPCINTLGSGLGYLIWGSIQITFGWATARFGWFGLDAEVPKSDAFEYVGVALTLVSAVMFALVKGGDERGDDKAALGLGDETPPSASYTNPSLRNGTLTPESLEVDTMPAVVVPPPPAEADADAKGSRRAERNVKIFGMCLAVFSGVMFGAYMTPITYMQTKVENAPKEGLDYAFAFSTGVVFTSTVYFAIYSMFMKNRPYINVRTAVPALIYGLIWAVAQFAWLYGNGKLSQSISYPIVTRAPAILAAIWGVFYFKEVQGSKNLLILAFACIVAFVGVICVGMANQVDL